MQDACCLLEATEQDFCLNDKNPTKQNQMKILSNKSSIWFYLCNNFFFLVETGSAVLPPRPPKCWDCRCTPPHGACTVFFIGSILSVEPIRTILKNKWKWLNVNGMRQPQTSILGDKKCTLAWQDGADLQSQHLRGIGRWIFVTSRPVWAIE